MSVNQIDMTDSLMSQDVTLVRIFSQYRCVLALLLLGLGWLFTTDASLGALHPEGYIFSAAVYFSLNVLTHIALSRANFKANQDALALIFFLDIGCLLAILFFSGKAGSGLTLLTLISVTAASILFANRLAVLVASLFALGLLASVILVNSGSNEFAQSLANTGLFCIFLMVTVWAVNVYTHRMRQSEILAQQRQRDTYELQRLNQLIVQQVRTGVIVMEDGIVRAVNDAAAQLLGSKPELIRNQALPEEVYQLWTQWKRHPDIKLEPIRAANGQQLLSLEFVAPSTETGNRTLIFMDDANRARQQAQTMKLTSLGRLTASIAHEVRNPLSAIEHAAQLLSESDFVTDGDRRLLEIIDKQSYRVNKIITDIQSLSRQLPASIGTIELLGLLNGYVTRWNRDYRLKIHLISKLGDVMVYFDESQLRQVLDNLTGNALRYTKMAAGGYGIYFEVHELNNRRVSLSILDNGPGVDDAAIEHLFEPFYTTEHSGTGLGLYISRELCLANRADLIYRHGGRRRKCFAIVFTKAERHDLASQ